MVVAAQLNPLTPTEPCGTYKLNPLTEHITLNTPLETNHLTNPLNKPIQSNQDNIESIKKLPDCVVLDN